MSHAVKGDEEAHEVKTSGGDLKEGTIPALSVCGVADYHLEGTIKGQELKMLVDTGTVISRLSKTSWDRLAGAAGELQAGYRQGTGTALLVCKEMF